ncbi:hypothetical protein C442_18399 [Haloarcula amylolytica JCM 13557]|uniref:VTT domain-containing protein n=2 Tax=Haloarcula amylolytica TaxID=396317 RepID=M0K5Q4_9EURY|nr:hypothetical protein C442_18399 [Haloarcula amylolytica JCM 13557]
MPAWRRGTLQMIPVVGLVFVIGAHWWYSPTDFFEHLDNSGWLLVASGVSVFYLVRPFVLWPLSIASVFLGYLVGSPYGVPLVLLGTWMTCVPPFLLADYFSERNSYITRLSDAGETVVTRTGELRGMIAARLSPAPADGISIGAGLAGVSGWAFTLGTLIGELPWAILYVNIGQSLRSFSSGTAQPINLEFLLLVSICTVLLVARPLYQLMTERLTKS